MAAAAAAVESPSAGGCDCDPWDVWAAAVQQHPPPAVATPGPPVGLALGPNVLPEVLSQQLSVLTGLLTPAECRDAVAAAEAEGFSTRKKVGDGGERVNARATVWHRGAAEALWHRLRAVAALRAAVVVPTDILPPPVTPGVGYGVEGGGADRARAGDPAVGDASWRGHPIGVSEHLRIEKYTAGQEFRVHRDANARHGCTAAAIDISVLSLVVYLNDSTEGALDGQGDFEGGATEWVRNRAGVGAVAVTPRAGTAVLFRHELLHRGCVVTAGTKYILRSDVVYRFEPTDDKT
mmetsp:Transcript_35082/g.105805  ORF Transcript_35082/g.105805 Transcript_35082/m.105805 type:complete len:293 (+) Transcript_35082:95-973(+)